MTSKGRAQMFCRGYKFYKYSDKNGKLRWCCTKRRCNAYVYTVGYESMIKWQDMHNHKPYASNFGNINDILARSEGVITIKYVPCAIGNENEVLG